MIFLIQHLWRMWWCQVTWPLQTSDVCSQLSEMWRAPLPPVHLFVTSHLVIITHFNVFLIYCFTATCKTMGLMPEPLTQIDFLLSCMCGEFNLSHSWVVFFLFLISSPDWSRIVLTTSNFNHPRRLQTQSKFVKPIHCCTVLASPCPLMLKWEQEIRLQKRIIT